MSHACALIGVLLSPGRHTNVSDSAALAVRCDWCTAGVLCSDWSTWMAGGGHVTGAHNTIGIITFLVLC